VKVAYIIYNERPMSGLIRTQVMLLLKEIKSQAPDMELVLISFWQPWVVWKFGKQLDRMKAEMAGAGIGMEVHPWALIPSRYFLYDARLFPILHRWVTFLFRRAFLQRFDIVHCRSYLAALVAVGLKDEFGYRCIFDMRSLFPKENVSIGKWTMEDRDYLMWARLEKKAIERSDASVGVSYPMIKEIERIVPGARGVLIPACADTRILFFSESARKELRAGNGWDERLVIVYEGSLGVSNSWNNIHNYGRYFSFISKCRPDSRFLILTPSGEIGIQDVLSQYGITEEKIRVLEAEPGDLHKWLSAADIGIHVMSPSPDSDTRLGVKVVEYLSCGLPVLVNSNVGGAAGVITTRQVGAVIDLDDEEEARNKFNDLLNRIGQIRSRCRDVAEEMFSVESCAKKYLDLYAELHGDRKGLS
jgi:glycosyltransferase involved in cell wall biosynthesis